MNKNKAGKILKHIANPHGNAIVRTPEMIEAFRVRGAKVIFDKGELTVTFEDSNVSLSNVGKTLNPNSLTNNNGNNLSVLASSVLEA